MKFTIVLLVIMAMLAVMATASQKGKLGADYVKKMKKQGKYREVCLKGKLKNGRCRRAVLRVRSADSGDFIEIPDVEDAHWADEEPAVVPETEADEVELEEI